MSHDSQSPSPSRPDLDEVINVTSAHSKATASAAREYRNPGTNKEPLSVAAFALFAVMIIVGGAVLGKTSGALFDYQTSIKPKYIRDKAPGVVDEVALPPSPILAVYVKKGQALYTKCAGCHQPDGKGNGNNVPSLAGSAWVTGPSERFSQVILNGLQGPTSTGKVYDSAGMGAFGQGLSPQELAFLMTFVRNSFGNSTGDVVTAEMAQAAIDLAAKRPNPSAPVTADELKQYEKDLAGEKIDPTTLVDPITLKPVEAK